MNNNNAQTSWEEHILVCRNVTVRYFKCIQDIFFAPLGDLSIWLAGWTPSASELQVKAVSRTPQEEWRSAGGNEMHSEMNPFIPP